MSVVRLHEKRSTQQEETVALLREALALAESGTVIGATLMLDYADETFGVHWTPCKNLPELIGKIELIKAKAMKRTAPD